MKIKLLHPLNQSTINSIKYHPNWYKFNYLTEDQHLFQPNPKSKYQKQIYDIANIIYNKSYKYQVNLYTTNDCIFDYYEFLLPFADIPYLNIISKLKIYVAYENDILEEDALLICADYGGLKQDINSNEWPLYKSEGTTIQLMSIILVLPENYDILDICNKLLHELRHSIEYIKNEKLALATNNANEIYEILQEYYIKYKKEYNTVLSGLYQYVMNCVYYTQDTEINAHIESTILELKKTGISGESIIELCKKPNILYNFKNTSNIELASLSINDVSVFYQYLQIKNASKFYLNLLNQPSFLRYNNALEHIYNILIQYYNKKKYKSIQALFEYFLKQSEKYFKNLNSAVSMYITY